jgi:hypothetical protein
MRLSYLIHSIDDILPMFVDLMNNSYASAELMAIDVAPACRNCDRFARLVTLLARPLPQKLRR